MDNKKQMRKRVTPDICLCIVVLLLVAIGLLAIYSVAATKEISRQWRMQCIATGIGVLGASCLQFFDLSFTIVAERVLYIGSVAVLFFVWLFGTGKAQTGANSWIHLGPVMLQPSEPIKVIFALVFAQKIARMKEQGKLQKPQMVGKLVIQFSLIFLPVILQNDTGTAFVFLFMFVAMLFAGELNMRYFVGAFILALIAIPVLWMFLAPYQKDRILIFLQPETDPLGAGYQVMQSKLSVASGGVLGRGWMQGVSNRFSLLPEKETDFIFGVIGEEFGFLGCLILESLLFFLCIRCLIIAEKAKDVAGKLVCVGIGAMYLFHITENLCMCLGLLPVTGIPLPFISYGGSAQVTNLIAIGVVLNISMTAKTFRFYKH